ncbi:MAG: alpha/beta hydrolase, partial [Gammaproteobacteria bacterium]
MKKNYLWTKLKARLEFIRVERGENYNWLFLPGGPGLGSESLNKLTQILYLPGIIWHLDLPGDGSNLITDDGQYFSHWFETLLEAVGALENVILVAHSTGGMYALATPGLEKKLVGLILMDSAPNSTWQQKFMEYVKKHPLAEVERWQKIYAENPNNEALKKLTLASSPYLFTTEGLKKDISFLETLPINYKACEWSALNFDNTYEKAGKCEARAAEPAVAASSGVKSLAKPIVGGDRTAAAEGNTV